MKKSLFENNNLTYREENGHLVPDVELPEQKEIGKWVQLANYVANVAKEIVESEVLFR